MDSTDSTHRTTVTLNPHETLVNALPCLENCISRLTGKIRDGQVLPTRTKIGRTIEGFLTFLIGTWVGVVALPIAGVDGAILLPFAMGAATAGARDLQLSILHHAAHDNVLPHKDRDGRLNRKNDCLGRIIAGLLLIERFQGYKPSHTRDHHGRDSLSGCEDGTVLVLQKVVEIKPGLPVSDNCRRLLIALISPKAHLVLLKRRLIAQFTTGTRAERAAAGLYVGVMAAFAAATGWWIPLLLGWVLPLTVGYQTAQMLRFVVEHHWEPASAPDGRRSKADYDALTVAVRCVAPFPLKWTVTSTLQWSAEMAINLIVRLICLPGDSGPSHGWHHSKPRGDWPNHIREAHAWEAAQQALGSPPTQEAWGIISAIRMSLESFANTKLESCP